jgi:glycosyltransferase involved in cell wall biosynthesis
MGKRILLYVPTLGPGGAERVCVNLANHWAEAGEQVTVATLSTSETDHYRLHTAISRHSLGLLVESKHPVVALHRNIQRIRNLRGLLRATIPDVAIAFMSSANIVLAFASTGSQHTICIGSEHTHPPKLPLGTIWERLRTVSYGRLDAVTALTEQSAAWLRRHTNARRVVVIPNPIPYPLPDQPPHVDPLSVGVDKRKRLLAIGRLTHQKGFDLLISAYSKLAHDFPNWELVILGEGELRQDMEQQIEALGLGDSIFLPGVVGNVGAWLESAKLFVLSSRFEGFANVLVEALNYGLPAVSFDCETGPSDIIRHEIDGLLVPTEDVSGLASSLGCLMRNEDFRHKIAARAVEARQRFSMHGVLAAWEQLM